MTAYCDHFVILSTGLQLSVSMSLEEDKIEKIGFVVIPPVLHMICRAGLLNNCRQDFQNYI